LQQKLLN